MTDSNASTLMRWKIASRRMPALLTTPSSLPKWSVAVLTILLAGIASATVSKLATAVPPRCLISSTTSSAGAALVPEPSDAPPGSLTTTLAPSAPQSSAISRPMPRPAPVTMMTLPSSDLAMSASCLFRPVPVPHTKLVMRGLDPAMTARMGPAPSLPFVRKYDRATRGEHAADAMAHRNPRVLHLRRRDAAHLAHAFLQRVHAVHARMHVGEAAAIGVERQLAARPCVAGGD